VGQQPSGFTAPSGFRESPARALASGEVIASAYQIRDEVARTDTGIVFEARDMHLDRAVAFKLAWRDPGTPSLTAEARRCAAVSARCAVAVHGMGIHNGVQYAVAERVAGKLLRELLDKPLGAELYVARLRTVIAAVCAAHGGGIAVGDISGSTILVDERAAAWGTAPGQHVDDSREARLVLGRLSLSQVPAFGPHGRVLAPEVARGEADAQDPAAAEMIDVYNLGCFAVELACGTRPFAADDLAAELDGHAHRPPPRLVDLRPDLPEEVSHLVEALLAKQPAARPRSAADVLAQLDAIINRRGTAARTLRVLVVDDDVGRARRLWSLARRAHPSTSVEIASEGTDAAHKLNRDQPDLVFVAGALRGVMNAFELCMYARGLQQGADFQLVILGSVAERDRTLLDTAGVTYIADEPSLPHAFLDRVRAAVHEPRTTTTQATRISG
jgi:serine/threonine protein kinase